MKLIAIAIACAMLSACASTREPIRTPSPAVAITCPACTDSCLPEQWPLWTGDPSEPATWDALPLVAAEIREIAQRCDVARSACSQCVKRMEDVGLVCGVNRSCE